MTARNQPNRWSAVRIPLLVFRCFVGKWIRAACVAWMLNHTITPRGEVVITEFAAGNQTGLKDENGEAHDWIELQNRGTDPVDLLGWSLTDDRSAPAKWVFPKRLVPPGEFLVVFASGKDRRNPPGSNRFHTNFKLNVEGEYLALHKPGTPQAAVTEFAPKFPEQRNGYSYGLDSSDQWRYFEFPTPGKSNGVSAISGMVPPPTFSVERGRFDEPFELTLSTSMEGAVIRYTLNGLEPSATAGLVYNAPLRITNTTTLRAATFKDGCLPARTRTHTYFFLDQVIHQPNNPAGFPSQWGSSQGFPDRRVPADYEMDSDPLRVNPNDPASPIDPVKMQRFHDGLRELPLVSIVMKTEDMFGASGLYPQAREAQVKPSNEKTCSVEMLLPDGKSAFAVTCGIDLHGNASRNPMKSPKHGFKLAFKSALGESELKYRLFPDSPAKTFDDLILRPDFGVSWLHWSDGGNELGSMQRTRAARIRDAWFKNSFRDMGHAASFNRFCHLFINGLYWGVYDFTEQPTESFARNQFGGRKEDYDIYDQGARKRGSGDAFNSLVRLPNLDKTSNYEAIQRFLDLPEFTDYMLLHFFVGHQDWGYNKNWYAIQKHGPGPESALKFIPWDGENLLLNEDYDRVTRPDVPAGLHTKLMNNAEYRLFFADRVFKHMLARGGALTPPMNMLRWRKWQAVLDKPIVAESMRWGDYRRDVHRFYDGKFVLYTRERHWLPENERIVHSYLVNRNNTVLKKLRDAGLYPRVDAPAFNQQGGKIAPGFDLAMSTRGGTIYYSTNGVDPRVAVSGAVSPKAFSYAVNPVRLAATTTVKARVLLGKNWSALNETVFFVDR